MRTILIPDQITVLLDLKPIRRGLSVPRGTHHEKYCTVLRPTCVIDRHRRLDRAIHLGISHIRARGEPRLPTVEHIERHEKFGLITEALVDSVWRAAASGEDEGEEQD